MQRPKHVLAEAPIASIKSSESKFWGHARLNGAAACDAGANGQLSRLARSAPPGAKTNAIRHDIMEGVRSENLEGAAGLPEPLADLGHFLLETAVDPSSEFSDAPCAEVDDSERALGARRGPRCRERS